jgi:hypothetical protein
MSRSTKRVLRLAPARPADGDALLRGFRPERWRVVLLGLLLSAFVLGGYALRERRKATALREHIERAQRALAPASQMFMTFRSTLEQLTLSSAADDTDETFVAPDFELSDLQSGRGSYLRIALDNGDSAEHVAQAAKTMTPDWIPSCLGLAPKTARELYEVGEFLAPEFVSELGDMDVMQLRVHSDTMARRTQTDLPSLLDATHADWFMLVLQEGESRRDDPVRVFIWDLRRDALLLKTRTHAQGIVVSARLLSHGRLSGGPPDERASNAAAQNDCSIAATLKKLTEH